MPPQRQKMVKLQWYCENIYALSGYSDEARVMVRLLTERGFDITVIGKNRQSDQTEFRFNARINPEIPVVYHTFRHGRTQPDPEQVSIVRSMLEVSRIPQNWVFRFNRMNEVWVPNDFNFSVFENSGVDRERLFVIHSPVDLNTPSNRGFYPIPSKKKFFFLTLFHYPARDRKGLDILLQAFCRAFKRNQDVCLVIKSKTSLPDIRSQYKIPRMSPEIVILNRALDEKELASLYRTVHCFVLPSRGEGIGRPFLDAMKHGLPIIASGWGGQREFLNEDNSFLCSYKLVDVPETGYLESPGFFGARWAETDPENLKQQLLEVFHNRGLARQKAVKARDDVRCFSPDRVAAQVMERMKKPLPKKVTGNFRVNMFERLFPVYYPKLSTRYPVYVRHRNDFRKKVRSVAISGTGYPVRKAFYFVSRQAGIKDIIFLSGEAGNTHRCGHPQVELRRFSPRQRPVDVIIIAEKLRNVSQAFHSLIGQVDTIPIYVFD